MERNGFFILLCIACIATVALAFPTEYSKLATELKSGQEYVFVQSTGSGARPIARKDKSENQQRPFESAHKITPGLTFALNDDEETETAALLIEKEKDAEATRIKPVKKDEKKVTKRATSPAEPPAPAPPATSPTPILTTAKIAPKHVDSDLVGSASSKSITRTKGGPKGKVYEYEYIYYYYNDDDEDPKDKNKASSRKKKPSTTTTTTEEPLTTRPGRRKVAKKRVDRDAKEDASHVATSPSPILTTAKIVPRNDDSDLVGSANSKSITRTKGGPKGKDYEYEYVYYYYNDDKDSEEKDYDGLAKNTTSDASDEPTKHAISRVNNEVLASRARRSRRQLGEEDKVQEESLPANTTRRKNLHTTSIPENEPKPTPTRPRGKRPTTATTTKSAAPPSAKEDNVSDETQVALDPYAISQGTQKPFGEEGVSGPSTDEETDAGRKTFPTTSEAPVTESKPKSKLGRPSFGGRSRSKRRRTKRRKKIVSQSKPFLSRFGASRLRGRTPAPSENHKEESSSAAPAASPKASLSFNTLRGRGRSTTAAPSTEEGSAKTGSQSSSFDASSTTTARPPRRLAGGNTNIKALKMGQLAGGRTSSTTTTEAVPAEEHHLEKKKRHM